MFDVKKGCSANNACCEEYFGAIKKEMFYQKNWTNVIITQFIDYLNQCPVWYYKDRIKCSFKGMNLINYRRSLGLEIKSRIISASLILLSLVWIRYRNQICHGFYSVPCKDFNAVYSLLYSCHKQYGKSNQALASDNY